MVEGVVDAAPVEVEPVVAVTAGVNHPRTHVCGVDAPVIPAVIANNPQPIAVIVMPTTAHLFVRRDPVASIVMHLVPAPKPFLTAMLPTPPTPLPRQHPPPFPPNRKVLPTPAPMPVLPTRPHPSLPTFQSKHMPPPPPPPRHTPSRFKPPRPTPLPFVP